MDAPYSRFRSNSFEHVHDSHISLNLILPLPQRLDFSEYPLVGAALVEMSRPHQTGKIAAKAADDMREGGS